MLVMEEEMAVVCLQAQRVTGLPAAVQQIDLGICHRPHLGREPEEPPVCARASASRGVADFHNEVLLLHCGAAVSSVVITVSDFRQLGVSSTVGVFPLDLCQRQPGSCILSFVLSGAAAGAVLTLALHHRLVLTPTTSSSCLPLPLPGCCRRTSTNNKRRRQQQQQGHSSDESAGFITIEKQGRRPPSDNLVTTDDDADSMMKLEVLNVDSTRVEDEFLAMLELADSHSDSDLDLDMLIRDAEAELDRAPEKPS